MKKKILSIAIIASSMFAINQNVAAQQRSLIGIEGTPQMSWLSNKDDMNNNAYKNVNTVNGSFGVSLQYDFTKHVGVGISGLYSMQGQRYKLNGIERYKKVDYFKIPLLFVYTYDINPDVSFIGKIGPQLDFLTRAKLTDKDGNNIISDQSSAYKSAELAGVISAGFGFKLNEHLLLDASVRADCGFTNAESSDYKLNINDPLPKEGVVSTAGKRSITNNVTAGITIGLRYMMKYKKM